MTSQAGREQLFFKIAVYFAVITAVIGMLNLAASGAITLSSMGTETIPGQSVPDLSGVSSSSTLTSKTLDYTTLAGFIQNTTITNSGWVRSDGTGWTSQNPGWLAGPDYLSVAGVKTVNGVYDNIYHISNSDSSIPIDFIIYGGTDSNNEQFGYFIECTANTISLVSAVDNPLISPWSTLTFSGSNTAPTIETKFNPITRTINIIVNTVDAGTMTLPPSYNDPSLSGLVPTYAGMATDKGGVELHSIDGSFGFASTYASNPLGDLYNALGAFVAMATMFLTIIAAMIGLTTNPAVPFWLWAILGLPALATDVLIYLEMARGN